MHHWMQTVCCVYWALQENCLAFIMLSICWNRLNKNQIMFYLLVKAVWVHKNGEITVDFNFADEFQRILDYIECEHSALTPMEQKAAM